MPKHGTTQILEQTSNCVVLSVTYKLISLFNSKTSRLITMNQEEEMGCFQMNRRMHYKEEEEISS